MGRVGRWEEQLNKRAIKFKLQRYSGGDRETPGGAPRVIVEVEWK